MQIAHKPMTLVTRLVLWFVAGNALAGGLALLLFPGQTDRLFFWTIQPAINAALFGALYLTGAVAVSWAAWHGKWESARYLVPVLVSAGILISLTTLLHLDRFAPGLRLFYWLTVYIGAPLLAAALFVLEERGGATWAAAEPARLATRALAVAVGTILAGAGAVVLIAPGLVVAAWPWPTAPLMVRIFTSWFAAFGFGLLWFAVERDWRRLRPIANLMIAASVFDLAVVALHRADVTGPALNLAVYCLHLALFAVLGGALHLIQWAGRRLSPASAAPQGHGG